MAMDEDYELEDSVWKKIGWVAFYAITAGILLGLFTAITSPIKYVCSLVALYIAIKCFKRFSTWGPRISFIVSAIIVYFATALVIAIVVYMRDNPMPAG